jgi:hypothetical protein
MLRPRGAGRYGALADLVALSHLSFVSFMVAGGPLARRRPRLTRWHLAAVGAAVAVNLAGADCPLTRLEKHLDLRAGRRPYESGFLSHYLIEPVYPKGITGRVNLAILATWVVPTSLAYATRARRAAG